MARVFISYSRSDKLFVEDQLIPFLREAFPDLEIWYDQHIHGGADWWQLILKEIGRADIFIYLLSNEALDSPYCRSEFREALRLGKDCLPIMIRRLDFAHAAADLRPSLERIHHLDFTSGVKDTRATASLVRALNTLLRNPAALPTIVNTKLTPEPPVLDRRRGGWLADSRWQGIAAIAVMLTLITVIVGAGALLLLDNEDEKSPSSPTEFVALQTEEIPTQAVTTTAAPGPGFPGGSAVTTNSEWEVITQTFDDVEMVLVPIGCFMMGTDGLSDENPAHEQCFDQPFWIDKYEVTNTQFELLSGQSENASQWNEPLRPREHITWFEALAFCEGKRGVRLPSEREWEYAARGPESLIYPWGDSFTTSNTVYTTNSGGGTAEVGSKEEGVSWVGAFDLSGNVMEWTSTIYSQGDFRYPYKVDDGREDLGIFRQRVLRGGSWNEGQNNMRAGYRYNFAPDSQTWATGFRCARNYES
jgi:formylglycine-generating enzyme required for sulfatase activity